MTGGDDHQGSIRVPLHDLRRPAQARARLVQVLSFREGHLGASPPGSYRSGYFPHLFQGMSLPFSKVQVGKSRVEDDLDSLAAAIAAAVPPPGQRLL